MSDTPAHIPQPSGPVPNGNSAITVPEATPPAPENSSSWPPEWARSIAFVTGIGLIVWETVIDQAAHLLVYGPAFALTGLPLARGVEALLDKFGKGPPK